jgi:hypothetical protein
VNCRGDQRFFFELARGISNRWRRAMQLEMF